MGKTVLIWLIAIQLAIEKLCYLTRNRAGTNAICNALEVQKFLSIGGVAYPLLSLPEGLINCQTFDASEVIEAGEQQHGTEFRHRPEGGGDPGNACLEQSGREADHFIGEVGAR